MSARATIARATRLEMFASLHQRDFRLLVAGVGAANAVAATLGTTLLLKAVPPELRGRVMGARAMAIGAMLPGMMFLGMGTEAIGAPATLALDAVAYLAVIFAIGVAYPQLRRLT